MKKVFILLSLLLANTPLVAMKENLPDPDNNNRGSVIIAYHNNEITQRDSFNNHEEIGATRDFSNNRETIDFTINIVDLANEMGNAHRERRENHIQGQSRVLSLKQCLEKCVNKKCMTKHMRRLSNFCEHPIVRGCCTTCASATVFIFTYCSIMISVANIAWVIWMIVKNSK